jgi:putative transposase
MSAFQQLFEANIDIKYFGNKATIEVFKEEKVIISDEYGHPSQMTTDQFYGAYNAGNIEILKRREAIVYQPLTNTKDIEKAKHLELYFAHHILKEHQWSGGKIAQTIKAVNKRHSIPEEFQITPSTFRRRFKLYLKNDRNIIPVIKSHAHKCKKRLPEESLELAEKCLDTYYLRRDGLNVLQTFRTYELECDEHEIQSMSKSNFYTLKDSFNDVDVIRARKGHDAARNFNRTNKGSISAFLPGGDVEIDAVHPKVGLLCDITGEYIGVPIVYLAICRATRCIMAYSISYGTSPAELADAVAELIKNCVSIKQKPDHTQYGWPLTGLPYRFIGDAGPAFTSNIIINLMAQLKTSYTTTETCSPWRKPFIEGFNKTLRSQFCSALPGYARWAAERNTDKSVEQLAVLTLSDFFKALESYLLDHYHQNPHSGLFGDTPADYCKTALQTYAPRMLADMEKLHMVSGSEVQGRIQPHKGIQLNNVFYASGQLSELREKLKSKNRGKSPQTPFLYDKNDISKITIVDETTGELFIVETTTNGVHSGMSLNEFKDKIPKVTPKVFSPFTQNNTVLTQALRRQALQASIQHKEELEKKAFTNTAGKSKAKKTKPNNTNRLPKNHTDKKVQQSKAIQQPLCIQVPVVE